MGVSKNRGPPNDPILMGFSIVNHPFWGTPIFGNTSFYEFKISSSHRLGEVDSIQLIIAKPVCLYPREYVV